MLQRKEGPKQETKQLSVVPLQQSNKAHVFTLFSVTNYHHLVL